MRKQVLFFILIVALCAGYAQERPSFKDVHGSHITTDIQDNLYVWEGSSLNKYTPNGELINHYSCTLYGDITSVCATVASKVLVFFQESGTIQLLNNTLSPIGAPISLLEKNLFSITQVSLVGTNQIALYDNANQQLVLSDLNLSTLNKTYCNFGESFAPSILEADFNKRILLIDTLSGLYLFDSYGTFEKKINISCIKYAQYYGNLLYFLKENELWGYIPNTLEIHKIKDTPSLSEFRIGKRNEYYLYQSGQITTQPLIVNEHEKD